MRKHSEYLMFQGPEKKFQRHIAQYLKRVHKYAVLEQPEITDTDYYFAEDYLIAFISLESKGSHLHMSLCHLDVMMF
jgi:type I restriction enzyme R subunit